MESIFGLVGLLAGEVHGALYLAKLRAENDDKTNAKKAGGGGRVYV